jgi:outer membrane beta-barrel protein
MKSILRAVSILAIGALLVPELARAAEPERVVVRNRKYSFDNKFEATAGVGLMMVSLLTDHVNFSGALTYNLSEQFALELGGGYAVSRHTNVARVVGEHTVSAGPQALEVSDDFSDLWRLGWSAIGAVRWAPIYGKINVAAELPVHFKFYLLAGGGIGGMERDSLIYCISSNGSTFGPGATCSPGASEGNAFVPPPSSRTRSRRRRSCASATTRSRP